MIKRALLILAFILAGLIGGAIATKPKPGELKASVEEAMSAYAEAQAAAPAGTMKELSLPKVIEERDWILGRSYSVEQDGKSFACWSVSVLTVCDTPDH